MRLYVASSWRNPDYEGVLKVLRDAGHVCYDFKDPAGDGTGSVAFRWDAIDPDWQNWDIARFREALLRHPIARAGFDADFVAMMRADALVLVQPAGVSAHVEAGWAVGAGIPTVSIGMPREPDLMLATVDAIFAKGEEELLLDWLRMASRLPDEISLAQQRWLASKHARVPSPVPGEIFLHEKGVCNLQPPEPVPPPEPFEPLVTKLMPYATPRWKWSFIYYLYRVVPEAFPDVKMHEFTPAQVSLKGGLESAAGLSTMGTVDPARPDVEEEPG